MPVFPAQARRRVRACNTVSHFLYCFRASFPAFLVLQQAHDCPMHVFAQRIELQQTFVRLRNAAFRIALTAIGTQKALEYTQLPSMRVEPRSSRNHSSKGSVATSKPSMTVPRYRFGRLLQIDKLAFRANAASKLVTSVPSCDGFNAQSIASVLY